MGKVRYLLLITNSPSEVLLRCRCMLLRDTTRSHVVTDGLVVVVARVEAWPAMVVRV